MQVIKKHKGEIMEEQKTLISNLAKAKNNVQSILTSLKSLERITEYPEKHLNKIKTEISKIDKKLLTNSLIEPLREEIASINACYQEQIPDWEERTKKAFTQELEGVLEEAGYLLRGDYTRLMVSLFTLELDLDNLKVIIWYGNKQEKVITSRLNPEDVAKKLTMAEKKIFERDFDSSMFLSQLYEAYKLAEAKITGKKKSQVAISDILTEYVYLIQPKKFYLNPAKSNFIGYERTFFSYDLFRLEQRNLAGKELNLITATRAFTRKKSDYLWVPSDLSGNGDYISHISFREE
jgi:hypothetical protein